MIEKTIDIDRMEQAVQLFGSFDENIKELEKEYGVTILSRGTDIKVSGDAEGVYNACKAIDALLSLVEKGEVINDQRVRYVMDLVRDGSSEQVAKIAGDVICITAKGRPLKPKTLGQKKYVESIRANTVTLGIGPAGTGKTYLAVAMAVQAFKAHEINRIILTRPAVEAGEKLGFLPGDLQNKVDPYLRPLYDALFDMLGAETFQKYQEKGNIEVAPLAYMRGRTLDDSFIILDGLQFQGGHHRRHHPDRPARFQEVGSDRGTAGAAGSGGHRHCHLHREGRGASQDCPGHHQSLRALLQ